MSRRSVVFVKRTLRDARSAQQRLLRQGGLLKQLAPDRDGDRLVEAKALGCTTDVLKNGSDPLWVTDAFRVVFETGDVSDLTLASGDEPHQQGVDTVYPRPPDEQFGPVHAAGLSPTARAPAAPCR